MSSNLANVHFWYKADIQRLAPAPAPPANAPIAKLPENASLLDFDCAGGGSPAVLAGIGHVAEVRID
jgi:hypothetical protein